MDALPSSAPNHPKLRVELIPGRPNKVRKTYLICGMAPANVYLAYNNSILSMARAVLERIYFVKNKDGEWKEPPQVSTRVFETVLAPFKDAFKNFLFHAHPYTPHEFAESYTGQKKERYLRSADWLSKNNITEKHSYLKMFMKFECYSFTSKEDPSPRGINPRSDEYLVALGAYLRRIEKRVFKIIHKIFGYRVVTKGLNAEDKGNLIKSYWESFHDPVAISADASRFEQSVSVAALMYEHSFYNAIYQCGKLAELLVWQLRNRGSATCPDGKLWFDVEGRRMSGDSNTALGNCLLSAAMAFCYLKVRGIAKHRVFLDGDDVVFIIERADLSRFVDGGKEWYEELGFRMKFEDPVYELEHIDYCQSHPVQIDGKCLMVRDYYKACAKDAVSKKPLNSKTLFRRWISAVGEGGISMCGGVPVMQEYYAAYCRNACGAKPLVNDPVQKDWDYKIQGMNRKIQPILSESRFSYWLATGLSPDQQLSVESHLSKIKLEYGVKPELLVDFPSLAW